MKNYKTNFIDLNKYYKNNHNTLTLKGEPNISDHHTKKVDYKYQERNNSEDTKPYQI